MTTPDLPHLVPNQNGPVTLLTALIGAVTDPVRDIALPAIPPEIAPIAVGFHTV
jgi:hypothetical protein